MEPYAGLPAGTLLMMWRRSQEDVGSRGHNRYFSSIIGCNGQGSMRDEPYVCCAYIEIRSHCDFRARSMCEFFPQWESSRPGSSRLFPHSQGVSNQDIGRFDHPEIQRLVFCFQAAVHGSAHPSLVVVGLPNADTRRIFTVARPSVSVCSPLS